jgi:hypothetical protein
MRHSILNLLVLTSLVSMVACSSNDDDKSASATVSIKNDFNDAEMAYQPPWTLCESYYLGQQFGRIGLGDTSDSKKVTPGLDYVLMVAAWDDTSCNAQNALPLASASEEEIVSGQTRTIALNMMNHRGPCPPTGVEPIAEVQYNRILALWPSYNFKPYAQRTENTECVGDTTTDADAGN